MTQTTWPKTAVDLVAALLSEAVARGASDLYWLPGQEGAEVRVRIAGQQETLAVIPADVSEKALTHLKVRAGLLTYKTKIAQDGRLDCTCYDRRVSARVASMPTIDGERITVRFQSQIGEVRSLVGLGFEDCQLESLRKILRPESGLILLTGPTGCGKTTTIYALLRELLTNDADPASIITVEDPVEARLPGISQSAVSHDDPDWNYETALRAALRQDLKTLVVGEIRDERVARMVIDAALSGHRVISTFHGGDVAGVYARLLHLGFEPFLIGAALRGVVAQRLTYDEAGTAVPVAAIHRMDDDWRDFLCTRPGLGAMRERLQSLAGADLADVAAGMAAAGTLSNLSAARIGESS